MENSGLWVKGLFVVVGKVVLSLSDCDSILFLFSLLYFIFHTLLIHVLNPYPLSLPLQSDH